MMLKPHSSARWKKGSPARVPQGQGRAQKGAQLHTLEAGHINEL